MSTGFNEEESFRPPARYRRAYRGVLLEGLGKAIIEESEYYNNINGDAGIPPAWKAFRVAGKTIAYFWSQNAINLSKSPGEKWKILGPMDILRDQGQTCNYCFPGSLST
jgi:hypothetical protein